MLGYFLRGEGSYKCDQSAWKKKKKVTVLVKRRHGKMHPPMKGPAHTGWSTETLKWAEQSLTVRATAASIEEGGRGGKECGGGSRGYQEQGGDLIGGLCVQTSMVTDGYWAPQDQKKGERSTEN